MAAFMASSVYGQQAKACPPKQDEVKPVTAWDEDDGVATKETNQLVSEVSKAIVKTNKYDSAPLKNFANRMVTGLWLLVLTVPLYIPEWNTSFPEDIQGGSAAGWAALCFLFTIGANLAKTLNQVWQAMFGLLLAWCNIWIVDAILGNKAVSNSGQEALVWIDYIIVLLLMLYFNLGGRAQLIAIHFTTSFAMVLLNPKTDLDYMEKGIKFIKQTALGCGFAIIASILTYPGPRLLTWDCSASMLGIANNLTAQFHAAHAYYSSANAGPLLEKWRGDIQKMIGAIHALNGKLHLVWWEGFDLCCRSGEKRDMMLRVNALYLKLADIMLIINTAIGRGFKESHADTMKVIEPDCKGLLQSSESLLTCLTSIALDGRITEQEKSDIAQEQASVVKRIDALGERVKTLHQKGDYDPNQHSERMYVWALAWFAETIVTEANAIVKHEAHSRVNIGIAVKNAFLSAKPTWQHFEFMIWNASKILITFLMGKREGFKSGFAVNTGWLVEKHLGASFAKDLQRLLGVTLPYVFGGVVYTHNNACDEWSHIFRIIIFYMLEVACLHIMFSGHEWAYVALLSAVFTPFPVLKDCDDNASETAVQAAMYGKVQDCVVAVFVIMACNFGGVVLESFLGALPGAPSTASVILSPQLSSSMNNMGKGLIDYFNGEENFIKGLGGLQGQINGMVALNAEAKGEPRLWKKPWPGPLVDQILEALKGLRLCHLTFARLGSMDLKKKASDGSFDICEKDLRETVQAAQGLLENVLNRQEAATVVAGGMVRHQMIEKASEKAHLEVLPQIIHIIAKATDDESSVKSGIDSDPIIRLSVFLCTFQCALGHVGHVSRSIFKYI